MEQTQTQKRGNTVRQEEWNWVGWQGLRLKHHPHNWTPILESDIKWWPSYGQDTGVQSGIWISDFHLL